ncbi:MAG: ABC transporter permease [Erysipelotrichaceae bacterium]
MSNIVSFFENYGDKLLTATLQHLMYVLVSVSIAFVVALVLGIILSRFQKAAKVIVVFLSTLQTIPGIVFMGVLFIYLGMQPLTVVIALTTYAIFPILKNTFVGIQEVPYKYKEAAKGCGMSELQILIKVELPLALPAILTGLKMATIYTVSWAVLAAMIGQGGLGDLIYMGIESNRQIIILGGAIPSALLALFLGWLIDKLIKKCEVKGVR